MTISDKSNKKPYAPTLFPVKEDAAEEEVQTAPRPPCSFYLELKEAVAERARKMELEEDLKRPIPRINS